MSDGPRRLEDFAFPGRDVSLAGLIRRLSEPDSGKTADNLVSNEDSYPRVAGELRRRVPPQSVYLGVGPDQNFTFIAHARSLLAFVVDFRRRNLRLHLLHKALIELSATRAEYLQRLTARAPRKELPTNCSAQELISAFQSSPFDPKLLARYREQVREVIEPKGVLSKEEWFDLATIQAKLAGPGLDARFLALPMYPTLAHLIGTTDRDGAPSHWLAREEFYQAVRERQISDRVIPFVGDLAGPAALRSLATWLEARKLTLGAIYVSDVEFFLIRSGKLGTFADNLRRFPRAKEAILIRTSTREIRHSQRVKGDSSTTLLEPVERFLARERAGEIQTADDLFKST